MRTGPGPKNTPLLVAAIYGRADIIRLLCQAGANVNYRRSPCPGGVFDFPLCLCLGCPAAVRELLRFGADPSMKCELAQYSEPETEVEVGKIDGHQKRISAKVVAFPHFDPKKTRVRS